MPENGTLYVFAFFSLREFIVAPVLALFYLNRTPIRRSRQYTQGVVHSAIAGGLATILVTLRQNHQIDSERAKKGEPPSAPPEYRAFAISIGQLCAIVQFVANIVHLWRAPAPPIVADQKEQDKLSDSATLDNAEDEAYKIDGMVILKLTGGAYLAMIIFGILAGSPLSGVFIGLPSLLLVPVFFWQRDYVIGSTLHALATPQSRALNRSNPNRWTSKMFESALAGGFTGFCAAVFTAYLSTVLKSWNNDPEEVLHQYDAFATSGAHVAVVCQFVVNVWSTWRSGRANTQPVAKSVTLPSPAVDPSDQTSQPSS